MSLAAKARAGCVGAVVLGAALAALCHAANPPAPEQIAVSSPPKAETEPAGPPMPDHYSRIDMETVTPHVKWMKPNAGGTTSVRFVCQPDFFKYSVRELAERFDLKTDFSLICQKAGAGVSLLDEYDPGQTARLDKDLDADTSDVIFACNLNWNWLPKEMAAKLLDRVEKGLGVVIVGEETRQKPFLDALQERKPEKENSAGLESCSAFLRESGVRLSAPVVSRLGQGRVIFMASTPWDANDHMLPRVEPATLQAGYPIWEHVYALYGRCIVSAAGKDAGATIVVKELTGKGAIAQVKAGEAPAKLRVLLADDRLNVVASEDAKAQGEEFVCAWKAPPPPGRYLVGVVALDAQDKALGFAAMKAEIKSPVSISIAVDEPFVRGDDRPVIEIGVTSAEARKVRVEARLVDSYGRTLYLNSQDVQLGPDPLWRTYDLKGVPTVARGHRFAVSLFADTALLGRVEREIRIFPLKSRGDDDFFGAVLGASSCAPYVPAMLQRAKEAGLESLCAAQSAWDEINKPVAVDMGFDFYGVNTADIYDDQKFDSARNWALPSPWDPAKNATYASQAHEVGERFTRELGVDNYILQDEFRVDGRSWLEDRSPETMKAFRAWLRAGYASMAALNAQWGTNLKDYEEVEYPDEKTNPSAWSDWCAFWDGLMVKHVITVREAIRQANPRARVGLSGTQNPGRGAGMDYWLLLKEAEYFQRNDNLQEDLMLSFGSGNLVQGMRFGCGSDKEGVARHVPWMNLFKNGRLVAVHQLYAGAAPNADTGITFHDATLRPFCQFLGDEMRRLTTGLGKLIIACESDYDPIAIYHSQRTNNCTGDRSVPIKRMLEDAGFDVFYVDSRDVVAGELAKRKVKVLFLPQITCISEAEHAALAQFVEEGGVLVADINCGDYDGHARPWQAGGILDKLFGIRRDRASPGAFRSDPFHATADAGPKTKTYAARQPAQAGLILDGAKPWLASDQGGVAAAVNKVGKGAAVYLNLDFAAYPGDAGASVFGEISVRTDGATGTVHASTELLADIIEDLAGMAPRAAMLVNGQRPANMSTFFHRAGDLQLVSFLVNGEAISRLKPEDARTATFRFPGKAHVYELRTEPQYFGKTDAVQLKCSPSIPAIFALLPYEVDKVELTAPARAKGGDRVKLTGRVMPKGAARAALHVIRLEAFRPDGSRFDGFCANLIAKAGQFEYTLPLALDEKPGAWKLVATDVISKKSATVTVEVGG